MTMLPTFLAGTNFVMHSAGWLEGGLVSCYEKFIVDIELLRMLKHEFTPLEIDEESLAFGAHEEVGSGGHFLGADAHARALPRVLLPAAAVLDRELRPLDAQRRPGRGRAGGEDLARHAGGLRGAADRRRGALAAAGVRRPAGARSWATEHRRPDRRARLHGAARPHRHAAAAAGHGAARGRADARAGHRPHAAARGGQAARARGPRRRDAAQRHVRHRASRPPTSSTSPRSAPSWRGRPPSSPPGGSTASCASARSSCSTASASSSARPTPTR